MDKNNNKSDMTQFLFALVIMFIQLYVNHFQNIFGFCFYQNFYFQHQ